jgi:hypothetical protein
MKKKPWSWLRRYYRKSRPLNFFNATIKTHWIKSGLHFFEFWIVFDYFL